MQPRVAILALVSEVLSPSGAVLHRAFEEVDRVFCYELPRVLGELSREEPGVEWSVRAVCLSDEVE